MLKLQSPMPDIVLAGMLYTALTWLERAVIIVLCFFRAFHSYCATEVGGLESLDLKCVNIIGIRFEGYNNELEESQTLRPSKLSLDAHEAPLVCSTFMYW